MNIDWHSIDSVESGKKNGYEQYTNQYQLFFIIHIIVAIHYTSNISYKNNCSYNYNVKTVNDRWKYFRMKFPPAKKTNVRLLILFIICTITLIINIFSKNYGSASLFLWISSNACVLALINWNYLTQNNQKIYKVQIKNLSKKIIKLICFFLITSIPLLLILITRANDIFFHGDEAIISRNAEKAVEHSLLTNKWNFFGPEDGSISGFPAMWYILQGFIIHFLGPSVFSLKLFSLLTNALIALIMFMFFKKIFNKYFAFLWLMGFITYPPMIHFGLTGLQNIQSTFFSLASLILVSLSLINKDSDKSKVLASISGFTAGLGMYFYLSSYLTPVYCLISILIAIYHLPLKVSNLIRSATIFLVAYIISSLPFWIVSVNDYNFLLGRASAFSSVISDSTMPVGKIAEQQLLSTIKPFFNLGILNGNGDFYAHLPAFSHNLIAGLFALGWLITIKNAFHKGVKSFIMAQFVLSFFITLFFGSMITVGPPAPQRIIFVFPLVMFFLANGLYRLFRLINIPWFPTSIFLSSVLLGAVQYSSYFSQNIPKYLSGINVDKKIQLFADNYQSVVAKNNSSCKTKLFTYSIGYHQNDLIYFYSHGIIDPTFLRNLNHDQFNNESTTNINYLLSSLNPDEIEIYNIKHNLEYKNGDIFLYQVF